MDPDLSIKTFEQNIDTDDYLKNLILDTKMKWDLSIDNFKYYIEDEP